MKKQFRILRDWKIENKKADAKNQAMVHISPKGKEATIYSFGIRPVPKDFRLHEYLHIALRALNRMKRNSKEYLQAEEKLVQDICRIKLSQLKERQKGDK